MKAAQQKLRTRLILISALLTCLSNCFLSVLYARYQAFLGLLQSPYCLRWVIILLLTRFYTYVKNIPSTYLSDGRSPDIVCDYAIFLSMLKNHYAVLRSAICHQSMTGGF